MTGIGLVQTVRGVVLLGVVASIVGVAGRSIEARPQAGAQVPVVSKDPAVQRQIELQLSGGPSARLDPNARIASLSLTARPLREILDAVAKAGGMTLRYASGITGLDTSSTVTLSDKTIEDALRAVLQGHALTFLPMGPKTAFIYPDTPASREKLHRVHSGLSDHQGRSDETGATTESSLEAHGRRFSPDGSDGSRCGRFRRACCPGTYDLDCSVDR